MTKQSFTIAFALVAACGVARVSTAQSTGPATTPPTTQPAPPAPSLDDLLNIDKDKPAGDANSQATSDVESDADAKAKADAAADEVKRELDKQLSEAEVANAFVQAVEKMSVAADLLDARFDPGLDTQRVQEDIIAKLGQLLDQAKKNKSNSSSSSSSSSSSKQQQQKQQDPGKKQGKQEEKNQQNQRNDKPADNHSEIDPPAPQDANANAPLEESRAEWGNLPQRVRDMLMQGRKDSYSPLYKRLTEEYYKRLAEEGSP